MKRAAVLLIVGLVVVGCSSSDGPGPGGPGRGGYGGGGSGELTEARAAMLDSSGGLGMLPPADWWHDPQVATPVNLTPDQFSALDAIGRAQSADVERLRQDSVTATRDFRMLLDADHSTAEDIRASGQRLKAVRGELLEHETRMIADERAVLSQQQWADLQAQLHKERSESRPNRGQGGYGNRGGRRGGGRGGMFPG